MASKKEVSILIKATDKASKVLRYVGEVGRKAMKGLAVATAAAAVAFTALSAAISIFSVKAIRAFAQFEYEMADVSTLIVKNADRIIGGLSKGVRQLALDIPKATSLLTQALYDLISAGVDVGYSLESLELSSKAAVGGSTSVAIAATLATGTINAFGLELTEMESIFDTAFATVRVGVTNFERLANSMGNVIAPAAKLKMDIPELFGSIAFLTKASLSSDEAATSLGRALDDLAKESKKLKKFGVEVFGEEGEFAGLLNVIRQLANVLNDLSAQERKDVLEEMGLTEKRALRALVPMIANIESLDEILGQVQDSAGATERAFQKMMKTIRNQWIILTNSFHELLLTIGEGFADMALKAIHSVKDMVDAISEFLKAGGSMTNLWKNHHDLVIAVLKDMAVAGVEVIGAMLSAMASMVASAAKLIWQPMKHEANKWWTDITNSIDFMMASLTSNIEDGTREGMERRGKAMMESIQKWNNEIEKNEIEHRAAMAKLTQEGIEVAIKSLGDLGEAGTTFVDKVEASLKAATAELKKFQKEAEKIEVALPEAEMKAEADDRLGIEEVVDPKILALREKLASQIRQLTMDQYDFEIDAANRYYAALEKEHKGDAETLALIYEASAAHLRDIYARRLEEELEFSEEIQEKIYASFRDQQAKKIALLQQVSEMEVQFAINALTEDGKLREAAIMSAKMEAQAKLRAGEDMIAVHKWMIAQMALIDQEAAIRKKEINRAFWEADREYFMALQSEINSTILQHEQERIAKIENMKQAAFDAESDRIANLDRQYSYYIGHAISISKMLFNAQKSGWMRTLAAIIRAGTRIISDYLKARAFEKLKQADIKMTEAAWERGHAMRMKALAAEAGIMALMAEAWGLLTGDPKGAVAAALYSAAAGVAFTEMGRAEKAAGVLETEALALQAEAASLMIAAVAVESAGEVVATGLELAADAADEAARKEEKAAQEKERIMEEEFRLQQQILELEGRGAEARLLALDHELAKYREMGLEIGMLQRWYELQQQQIMADMGAAATTPMTTAGGAVGGTTPTVGGQPVVNVYQTNYFQGFLDTANREQLRELAIMLHPFNIEIEELATNP